MLFYSANNIIYGVKLTISNNTLSFNTPSQIVDGSSAYCYGNNYLNSEMIDTNKWLLVYNYQSSSSSTTSRTYGIVVKYANNVFSTGTEAELTSQNYSGMEIKLCLVDTNKCVLGHRGNSYGYALGISISGTTISIGTDTQIGYSGNYNFAICSLGTDSFGAFYISSNYIYGLYCTLSNLTITVGRTIQLTSNAIASEYVKAIKVSDNYVFVSAYTTTMEEYGVICTISNNSFGYLRNSFKTLGMVSNNNNFKISANLILIGINTVIFHVSSAKNLSGLRLCKCTIANNDFTIFKKVILSNSKIDGVTVEELTDSVPGDVYVLN